jgi:hypothetical protein
MKAVLAQLPLKLGTRHQVVLEILELTRASNGNISGTEGILQLRHDAEFVEPAVDSIRGEHVTLPAFANESGGRIRRHFARAISIHLPQDFNGGYEVTRDRRGPEVKGLQQERGIAPELRIVLGDKRQGIEILIAGEPLGLAHTGGEVLPRNDCFDCGEGIAALLPRGDQCGTHFRVEPHLVVDGLALFGEGAFVLVFRLREKASDLLLLFHAHHAAAASEPGRC